MTDASQFEAIIRGLADRIHALETKEHVHGIWKPFTPTMSQTNAITLTVTVAEWKREGKEVLLAANLGITSAGVAGVVITVSIPAGVPPPVDTGAYWARGSFMYLRSGIAFYVGSVEWLSASAMQFMAGGGPNAGQGRGNYLGVDPSFGVANNDQIGFTISYKCA